MFSRSFFGYLARLFFLSLLFLLLLRGVFVIYHFSSIPQPTFTGLLQAFLIGALMDSSVLCSALMAALLISCLAMPLARDRTPKWFYHISNLLIGLVFFVNIADIFYFNQYGARLNMFAGEAMYDPGKIISTAWKIYPIIRILLCYFVLLLVFVRLHSRIRKKFRQVYVERPSFKWGSLAVLFLGAFSFLYYGPPLWTLANFSDSSVLNQGSLNGVYTLIKSWHQQRIYDSDVPAFSYYSDQEAQKILQDSIVKQDEKPVSPEFPFLREVSPADSFVKKNVVIILLESFGSRYVGKLNDGKGYSPGFDRYADSGMFFTHFHSNGPRTQNGIMSAVSGFPSILGVNLQRRKGVNEFQTLGNILLKEGYETQFLHNGHADYDDMDKFMRQGGFQEQMDVNDFKSWKIKNEWGVSDEDLYARAYEMLWNTSGKPVLSVLLTMSNHEPHEVPEDFRKKYPEMERMEPKQSTFFYSDRALADFLDKCSKHPQYKNTLFVIFGDHGDAYGPEDNVCKIFHIPCLILNSKAGKGVSHQTASQCDIPATVLRELNYRGQYHFIGQDLFGKSFKPYSFMRGYGNDVFLCRDSIMLKYYFETKKGVYYYLDRYHYQRPAGDVPEKVRKQMEDFTRAYMQAVSWTFRNGRYKFRE
jgi:phosphoglycerol transferase MdoB-like AlkP superfamily enzyme